MPPKATTVCVYVALLVLPGAAMLGRIHDQPIAGALPPRPWPAASLAAVGDESFQRGVTEWFESKLGFKGYAIYLDNTALYHAFKETRVGAPTLRGKGGVMFMREDVNYYNRTEPLDADRLAEFAGTLARLQTALRAQHRAFIPIIVPAKTSVYPDKVPDRWTRALGTPRPSDTRVYLVMKHALDRAGVAYVDARELLTHSDQPRDRLWAPQARHWSDYGSCLALREIMRVYVTLTGTPFAFDCIPQHIPGWRWHPDYDLGNLTNAWGLARAPKRWRAAYPPRPLGQYRPSTLLVGSSFMGELASNIDDSRLFGRRIIDYYNATFYGVNFGQDVHPHTDPWRDVVLDRDLYILDLFEVFLENPRHDTFVYQLADELPAALAARERRPSASDIEVPAAARGAPILDTWIGFAADAPGRALLVSGWSWGESWGTWSDDYVPVLALPVPPGRRLQVSLRWCGTAPPGQTQAARVYIDDQPFDVSFAAHEQAQDSTFEVTSRRGWLVVRLDIAQPVASNGRLLGIGLTAARVEVADPGPSP
ncbi:MAG TPA: hypothetical protein VHW23_11695 [Kofleriaceae bacterium]|jgi:hypothetical protein|nr:hypothetical protein [Kofleriaceae bacterium]